MTQTQYPQSAQKLLRQIQLNLSDTLTPEQSNALATFKGLDEDALCRRAMLDSVAYKSWLSGDAPILPPRQFDMLQLILGFERGSLVSDRIHLFEMNENKVSKEKLAQNLREILPMIRDCTRSLVSDETGKSAWYEGGRIYVLGLANGGYGVIRHTQKMSLGAQPLAQALDCIQWANHGASSDGARSDLVIPLKLSARLSTGPLADNDLICRELVGHFHAAQEIKNHGSFRAIKEKIKP